MNNKTRAARRIALFAVSVTFFGFSAMVGSQTPAPSARVVIPASSVEKPADIGLRSHTNIALFYPPGGFPASTSAAASGPPYPGSFFETPASLACVYILVEQSNGCDPNVVTAVSKGGLAPGAMIVIVDAYDDPTAAADLAAFSLQFGLPWNPNNFHVVYADGLRPPLDPNFPGWELEESLDIEWAHAMAPNAQLYLVEAASNNNTDLYAAVNRAAEIASSGVNPKTGAPVTGVVSNSWSSSEFSDEIKYDVNFTRPNVIFFASAGDSTGVSYPAASPNVIAVGGTDLSRNPASGRFLKESAWNSTGGGLSKYESRPSYQDSVASIVGAHRGTPDVAANAGHYSPVWVRYTGSTGVSWYAVNGTSEAAPVWAGIVAGAGGGGTIPITNLDGSAAQTSAAELQMLYSGRANRTNIRPITDGVCGPSNGYVAGGVVSGPLGYNLCTGIGSPLGFNGK